MENNFDKKKRSRIMSKIKSISHLELLLEKHCLKLVLGAIEYILIMYGNPDIIYSKKKLAIFIDGDFGTV